MHTYFDGLRDDKELNNLFGLSEKEMEKDRLESAQSKN